MVGVIILVIIGLCAGGIVWMRRRRRQAYITPVVPHAVPHETLVLDTFARGNSCLAEGKFADATAAFRQVLELAPKHPHVAGRLAEVERRQHAASATPPAGIAV